MSDNEDNSPTSNAIRAQEQSTAGLPVEPTRPLCVAIETRLRQRALITDPAQGDPGSRTVVRVGLAAVLALMIGLTSWASVARLAETAVTRGELVTDSAVKIVQHFEGGIIAEFGVSEGQLVDEGTLIARFDGTTARAELARLQSRRLALALRRERLAASVEGRAVEYAADDPNLTGLIKRETAHRAENKRRERNRKNSVPQAPSLASAWPQLLPTTQQKDRGDTASGSEASAGNDQLRFLINGQLEIQRSQLASVHSERDVIRQQIEQKNRQLFALRPERASIRAPLKLLEEELAMRRTLTRRGLEPKLSLLVTERESQEAKSELARLNGNLRKTQAEVAELERRLVEVDVRWQGRLLEEIGTVDAELVETGEQLATLEDRVSRLEVRAPVRALIQSLPVKTVGAVIPPGGILAELVPLGEPLVAETRINTTDIGFITAGQHARIKVDTFNYSRFGALEGQLQSVSATTLLDESGAPYYKARIKLAQTTLTKGSASYPLLPGMTVQADIGTGEKTLLEYLLKPIYTNLDEAFRER